MVDVDQWDAEAKAEKERQAKATREAEEARRTLEQLVDNADALPLIARQDGADVAVPAGGFQPDKTPSLSGSPVTCLIITNTALAPSFQVLADYRTARGMPTVVATREYIAANFRNGSDIQETIRLYIRDAYEKWGVQYVLLGGDSDVIPPRIIYNSLYPASGDRDPLRRTFLSYHCSRTLSELGYHSFYVEGCTSTD